MPSDKRNQRIPKLALQLERWLEWSFEIPGTNFRFGFDALIGLLPVIGDFITFVLSGVIVTQAYKDRVPVWTLIRMIANIAIDSILGAIPIFGDFADLFWRSNTKNIDLWKKAKSVEKHSAKDKWIVLSCLLLLMALFTALAYGSILLVLSLLQ